MTTAFSLNRTEQERAEAFKAHHNSRCSWYSAVEDAGYSPTFEFRFHHTGVGPTCGIRCMHCLAVEELTDYLSW